jgi:two-component system cell cycle sensor histidine kinase/response regulator CckA
MSSTLNSSSPSPLPTDVHGSEVILVVEDEPEVRSLTCAALRRLGYYILEAKDGEDALIVLQDYHGPVHLVMTDVVMPKMGGVELIRLLHEWYPELKVLFVSAYSRALIVNKGAFFPGARYLGKPFSPTVLARRIREILDAQTA